MLARVYDIRVVEIFRGLLRERQSLLSLMHNSLRSGQACIVREGDACIAAADVILQQMICLGNAVIRLVLSVSE